MADQEQQQTLTSEQAQQINFNNGTMQGYKEQIGDQADKIAALRGQINVRDGLLKEAQQQLEKNSKEIEDLRAKQEDQDKEIESLNSRLADKEALIIVLQDKIDAAKPVKKGVAQAAA